MLITFWGVRGSIATSGREVARTGGNTTCLEIEHDSHRLIIDAGTGLRALGEKIAQESRRLRIPPVASFFFTHLHWDHIQGFPFFGPAFRPDTRLDLHGPCADETLTLEAALAHQMRAPHFPVPLSAMPAEKRFTTIASGDGREIGPFTVRTRALSHPQGSLGYRVEAGGRSICFATDTEHRTDGTVDEALLDLARDVDLLIHDAQYTDDEYEGKNGTGPCKKGWGHSTYAAAAKIAKAAGARQLALFHHDPTHDDEMVEKMERDARTLFAQTFAARERQVVAI